MQCYAWLLVVASLAAAAPYVQPPSYDATRATLRAQQALLCWPPALTVLVNATIVGIGGPQVSDAELGRFFAVFYAYVSALLPLCPAYMRTSLALAGEWQPTMRPATAEDYMAYCHAMLTWDGNNDDTHLRDLALQTTVPLQGTDPLLKCMRAGAALAATVLPSLPTHQRETS